MTHPKIIRIAKRIFSMYGGLIASIAMFSLYAGQAVIHLSYWYLTFALYYLALWLTRTVVLIIQRKEEKGKSVPKFIIRCPAAMLWLLTLMTGAVVTATILLPPPSVKSTVPAIASATYAFWKFTTAFAKKADAGWALNSYKKKLGIVDAATSMFVLEMTMPYAFSGKPMNDWLICPTGALVFLLAAIMASLSLADQEVYIRLRRLSLYDRPGPIKA